MDFKSCSSRTRRRRVNAEVAKLVATAKCDEHSDGFSLIHVDHLDSISDRFSPDNVSCDSFFTKNVNNVENGNLCSSFNQNNCTIADMAKSCTCEMVNSVEKLENDGFFETSEFLDKCDWEPRLVDDSDSSDSDSNAESIREKLAVWATNHNPSHNMLTDLLHILRTCSLDVPCDARTLLNTDRSIETKIVAGGEYYYFGLSYWLQALLQIFSVAGDVTELNLHINIDGIPLFNSSKISLWPILGYFKEIESQPFPIALFSGEGKPDSIDNYLSDFVSELKNLKQFGFKNVDGKSYKINLDAVICDAPARAFVKCIKTHNAYDCCERCSQRGTWNSKILLPDVFAPLRSDDIFRTQIDSNHHSGISPLLQLDCGMVKDFPLDYMHLVCLGVMRRLIHQWISGHRVIKLNQTTLLTISDKLINIRSHIPREFSRKPRSILEYKQWKATELRLFLLYTGPIILKGVLSQELYSNFLDLSVAIRILLSPTFCNQNLSNVEQLLKYFVVTFAKLYGSNQLVYNVHSLIHLVDDARRYGALDNVSSFRFESYLGRLKKLVRRPQQPCAQIARRILEGHGTNQYRHDANTKKREFSKPHMRGPLPISLVHCSQFEQYHGTKYFISIIAGDNCFEVAGKLGIVKNVLREIIDDCVRCLIVFEEFDMIESFFTDPLDSKLLNVYFVNKLSGIRNVFSINDITSKYIMVPYKHGHVIMSQLHFC